MWGDFGDGSAASENENSNGADDWADFAEAEEQKPAT